ncbi:MAG: AMP-binding protein, partial [Clostridia bacterium]|nr:AMP-binding protein [Clostridia bacterium]
DFDYRFNKGGVRAVLCTSDGDVAAEAEKAFLTSPTVEIKVIVGNDREGWENFKAFEAFPDYYPRTADTAQGNDPSVLFFSSGTTGYPKIVAHSCTYPLGHFITAKYWHNVKRDGLHFTISDSGWGKFMWGKIYGQWLAEAAVFAYDFDRFHADDILPLFKKHNITTFCAPPTMYRFFIKEDLANYDLSSLTYATTAGEALNPEVYNKFKEYTGISLMEAFGQTETTMAVGNLVGMKPKVGSMGKPSPLYDVEIMTPDENGKMRPCKVGEVGEIVIHTDKKVPVGLFLGYFDAAYDDLLAKDVTEAAWHDDIYHTGDTAWCDEDGYYWYVGRTDDLIKSSGYRIGPFEIESVIMELPFVLEVAVTGVPDPVRGQVVKATIVPTKGTVVNDALVKEVQTYVKTHTAPYKYPRIVEFVDELPKTISGKIRRVEIRQKDQNA